MTKETKKEEENVESSGLFDEEPTYEDVTKYVTPATHNKWDFYLSDEMQLPPAYTDLCHTLRRQVSKRDEVTFYLNNFGGSCHGLISIVNAINACPASVHMVVTAPCYSAGASLALAGASLVMEKYSFLMFHNYSGGSRGKGEDIIDDAMHHRKWIYQYFRDLHAPFLTDEECERIENNRDVYIHYNHKDLAKRIKRHFKK